MATEIKKEMKGELIFNHVDRLMARFGLSADDEGLIRSKRELVTEPGYFPDGFDPAEYDVTGTYSFKVSIKPKPKKK